MPAATPPIALALVPGLLRARGLEVGRKALREALRNGVIRGRLEGGRWLLSPEELDAAERYFRTLDGRGRPKGGAAALARTGGRRRAVPGRADGPGSDTEERSR